MHKVDWTKWSAVAEILSAVAIIATLLYLAIQTQQTNNALFANSRAELMASDIAILTAWGSDEDVALAGTGGVAPEDLTPGQRARQQMLTVAFFRIREYAWFQYRDGLLDEEAWTGYMRPLLRTLGQNELNRIFWDQFSAELDQDLVIFVNERLAAP